MSRRFHLHGDAQTESKVEFQSYIDGDGDFVVEANGVRVLFISALNGDVSFFFTRADNQLLAGLKFNPETNSLQVG